MFNLSTWLEDVKHSAKVRGEFVSLTFAEVDMIIREMNTLRQHAADLVARTRKDGIYRAEWLDDETIRLTLDKNATENDTWLKK